jgi:hypothetical protein
MKTYENRERIEFYSRNKVSTRMAKAFYELGYLIRDISDKQELTKYVFDQKYIRIEDHEKVNCTHPSLAALSYF